jgi:PKD repeat protein
MRGFIPAAAVVFVISTGCAGGVVPLGPDGTTHVDGDAAGADASGPDVADVPDGALDVDGSPPLDGGSDSADLPALPLGLTTGALAQTAFCAGAAVEVPFTLSGGNGDTYSVRAEISGVDGSFDQPTHLGTVSASVSGVIATTFPSGLAGGSGYRVRVIIAALPLVAEDSGQTLEILALPKIELAVSPARVFAGETVRFIDNTANVASRTWTLPADSSVGASSDAIVDVTFSAPGVKSVQYDAVAVNGCPLSRTLDDEFAGVKVVSCAPAVPSGAKVFSTPDGEDLAGNPATWICGGGALSASGGAVDVFVEPGGVFHFKGGGGYTVYVRAGGTFVGGSGGVATVIYEPGALLSPHMGTQYLLECDSIVFDYKAAPVEGCIPAGTNPASTSVAIGSFGAGPYCPGAEVAVPVTISGAVGAQNVVVAQISDASGDFSKGQSLGVAPATASGTLPFNLPAELAPGGGYRLRVATSHPPKLSAPSAAFAVPEAALARFSQAQWKALVGDEVTFINESDAHVSAVWDFGAGANPPTSTASDGVTTYATAGWKTVSLTVTDALGCESTTTLAPVPKDTSVGFEVLSCDIAVPANATVLGPGLYDLTVNSTPLWVCGGAQAELFGGATDAIVEANGVFDFAGGGIHTFYVRSGGILGGSFGGISTLVYETGAFVTDLAGFTTVLECPAMTVDLSAAPVPGCAPYTSPPHSVAIGEPEQTAVCFGDGFDVPFSTTGIFKLDNKFRLQLSGSDGLFDAPVELGNQSSAASGSIYGSFSANSVAPGTGYRLRVTSDEPALASEPAAAVITVEASPEVQLEGTYFAEPGVAFQLVNNTAGDPDFAWSVDGAPYSSEANPSFTFTEHALYNIELTASTAAGCSDSETHSVKVVSCAPPIPPTATVVTGESDSTFGGLKRLWICNGGSASAGAGDYNIYIEAGGTFTFTGGGVYAVYVKAGGTFKGGNGGLVAVYAEPGAILNLSGGEQVVVECPSLAFDTTQAPPSGCK